MLLRLEGGWLERYYQMKSKEEGSGTWTLALLEKEGVLAHFFSHYRKFRLAMGIERREIEFVLAVEGDLHTDVQELCEVEQTATKSRSRLFASLCLNELISRDAGYGPVGPRIRSFYEENAGELLRPDGSLRWNSDEIATFLQELGSQTGRVEQVILDDLREASDQVAHLLDDFISSLRFDSRVGPLQEATLARLLASGDLSPNEARECLDRLTTSIQEECVLPAATLVDSFVLKKWIGSGGRARLETKPTRSPDWVERSETLEELGQKLAKEPFVLVYGLPKVGKSQLVSALVDWGQRESPYFWFTFSGDGSDQERFLRQLSAWCGEITSVWQPLEDVVAGLVQPAALFERLGRLKITDAYVILDDSHRCSNERLFELLRGLVCDLWSGSRLVLISKERIPSVRALGADEIPVGGFEPKEAVEFVTKLGLDLSDAMLEFAMLSAQVDGHPVMLRAAIEELPAKPSRLEVSALSQRLPSAKAAEAFLEDLSNRIFFQVLKTPEQRQWLARLAVVAFSFTGDLALKLAELDPRLSVNRNDWLYMSSLVLDRTRPDHYAVPVLLRQLASSESAADRQGILIASGRHILHRAIASREIDIWDFQSAILALLTGGRDEEAAMRLSLSLPWFIHSESFKPFEFLFMVMNGTPVHGKLPDPVVRLHLLIAELYLRLLDKGEEVGSRFVSLLKRSHGLLQEGVPARFRATLHLVILGARFKRLSDQEAVTTRGRRSACGPFQSALRVAVHEGDSNFIAFALGLYDNICAMVWNPDVDLLCRAIIALPAGKPLPISPKAVITLYTLYSIHTRSKDTALELLERHGNLYLERGLNDAYFACVLAAAQIFHDRGEYTRAMANVEQPLLRAAEMNLSRTSLDRGALCIGDACWAKGDYARGAEQYRKILFALDDPVLDQHVCERVGDALISAGQHREASNMVLKALRCKHGVLSSEHKARLYARLAYAFCLDGSYKKAAIACLGLCRTSSAANSDQLYLLSGTVAAWVLQHVDHSDPLIRKVEVQIRDSSALSDKPTPEQFRILGEQDPSRAQGWGLVAMLFDVLDELRRSEFFYKRAVGLLSQPSGPSEGRGEAAYLSRVAGVQIRQGKLAEAACTFGSVVDCLVRSAQLSDAERAKPGPAAYALLTTLTKSITGCSDNDLMRLFELLGQQFVGDVGVRAWLAYRQSQILFERLAAQAAKRRLAEAEQLAREASENDLYWNVVDYTLFILGGQLYSRWTDWLHDALDVALVIATESNYAGYRQSFGEEVCDLSKVNTARPFPQIMSLIVEMHSHWTNHAFPVAVYALWRVATDHRIVASSLNALEEYLKQNAQFLGPSYF